MAVRIIRVAPFMGAWIETDYWYIAVLIGGVAPFMGAWIETSYPNRQTGCRKVAPFMGAWIETLTWSQAMRTASSRTLHGCVD